MTYYIYKITSPSNRVYIGLTQNTNKRFSIYKNLHCKNQKFLYNSLIKYGWDNHIKEIVQVVNVLKDAEIAEIENILIYKQLGCSLNIRDGGMGGALTGVDNHLSKKVYQFNNTGELIKRWDCVADVERELKISVSNVSSACCKKNYYAKNYYWCYEEDIQNITFKRKIGLKGKEVYQLDNNFNIIKKFNSVSEAAKTNNIEYYGINECVSLKRKSFHSYYWVYAEKFNFVTKDELDMLHDRKNIHEKIKIYRIINNNKESFNSIVEASLKTNTTTLTIRRHLKQLNKSKKQIWFYE